MQQIELIRAARAARLAVDVVERAFEEGALTDAEAVAAGIASAAKEGGDAAVYLMINMLASCKNYRALSTQAISEWINANKTWFLFREHATKEQ